MYDIYISQRKGKYLNMLGAIMQLTSLNGIEIHSYQLKGSTETKDRGGVFHWPEAPFINMVLLWSGMDK